MSTPSSNPPVSVPQIERDPAFIDGYADQVRLGLGLGHVLLNFVVIDDRGPGHFVIREKGAVRLPLPGAKTLLAYLQAVIETYEQVVGKVPTPGNLAAQVEQMKENVRAGLEQELGPMREKPRG
jgi:hypothetical protein